MPVTFSLCWPQPPEPPPAEVLQARHIKGAGYRYNLDPRMPLDEIAAIIDAFETVGPSYPILNIADGDLTAHGRVFVLLAERSIPFVELGNELGGDPPIGAGWRVSQYTRYLKSGPMDALRRLGIVAGICGEITKPGDGLRFSWVSEVVTALVALGVTPDEAQICDHPYRQPNPPDWAPWPFSSRQSEIEQALRWAMPYRIRYTEVGYKTDAPQDIYLPMEIDIEAAISPHVGLYAYDGEFGLFNPDNTPRPAVAAIEATIAALTGT